MLRKCPKQFLTSDSAAVLFWKLPFRLIERWIKEQNKTFQNTSTFVILLSFLLGSQILFKHIKNLVLYVLKTGCGKGKAAESKFSTWL